MTIELKITTGTEGGFLYRRPHATLPSAMAALVDYVNREGEDVADYVNPEGEVVADPGAAIEFLTLRGLGVELKWLPEPTAPAVAQIRARLEASA